LYPPSIIVEKKEDRAKSLKLEMDMFAVHLLRLLKHTDFLPGKAASLQNAMKA